VTSSGEKTGHPSQGPGAEGDAIRDPLSMIDSHCHLDQPQFDDDREEVIDVAAAQGVTTIINPATNLDSCRRVLELAERHAGIYAAVGVHPNDSDGFDASSIARLRQLASQPKVVAIGEIGLDYYWKRVPPEQQKRALREQLTLAAELGLPVVLHSRDANEDLLWELAQWVREIRMPAGDERMLGVLHAFSGNFKQAEQAYTMGFLISLGGPVTFANARNLHALVPRLRLDRLMLETDSPYLAPHPYRGRRNEPGYLTVVARSMARLMAIEPEVLAQATSETARRCFRLHAA
jgi:TatD DNase family protein